MTTPATARKPVNEAAEAPADEIAVKDYVENMFSDGNNRTARKKTKGTAEGYDNAVEQDDAEVSAIYGDAEAVETMLEGSPDTSHSRDGSDASGEYDETGGPLGGTEEQLDSMEASGVPVDKTPQMKQ